MLDAIGTIDNAEPWLRDAVERGDRLMGFGHRVYKTDDPRSVMLRGVAEQLGGDKIELAKQIEAKAIEVLAELKPGRKLYTNVEFYAGIVMDRAGLPREMFTPTFASSRVIGWCAHILEQAADNRLIRPSARYVGPPPPAARPRRGVKISEGDRRTVIGALGVARCRQSVEGCSTQIGRVRRCSPAMYSRISTDPYRSIGTLRRSKTIGTLRFSLIIICVSPSWISPAISASC